MEHGVRRGVSIRQAALLATALAAGFLAGIAYSIASVIDAVPQETQVGGDRAALAAVGRLERLVREQHGEMLTAVGRARGAESGTGGTEQEASPARARPRAAPPESAVETSAPQHAQPAVRPADATRLAELDTWEEDAKLRRAWLFTPRERLLESFGSPDEVTSDGGGEWWMYLERDGERVVRRYRFRVSGDKLIDVGVFDDASGSQRSR